MVTYGPKPATHCKDCSVEFNSGNKTRNSRGARCDDCARVWGAAYAREWRRKNPEKYRAIQEGRRRGRDFSNREKCNACGVKLTGGNIVPNPEKAGWRCKPCLRLKNQEYRAKNKQRMRDLQNKSNEKLRRETYDHYGPGCACCGEGVTNFLTLDHINDNGSEHRKSLGGPHWGGIKLYRELRKLGWPDWGLQVMCYNCNVGRWRNGGACPHEEGRQP